MQSSLVFNSTLCISSKFGLTSDFRQCGKDSCISTGYMVGKWTYCTSFFVFYKFYVALLSQIRLSVCLSSSVCPSVVVCLSVCLSVCRLSVTFLHPHQPVKIFSNVSTPFSTLAVRWPLCKCLQRSSQGNPSIGGWTQEELPNIAMLDLSKAISLNQCKIRPRYN